MIILAGDMGGTKSNLGVFERDDAGRPRQLASATFNTHDFSTPQAMLATFLEQSGHRAADLSGACLGLAGPVEDGVCVADWLPWKRIVETDVAAACGIRRLWLINDMVATAYGVTVLHGDQLVTLNRGEPKLGRNIAVIAAGTGLGEAALIADRTGHYHAMPAEGGHTDFAPRNELELGLFQWLFERVRPVTQEAVICGRGLVNVYTYLKWKSDPRQAAPPLPKDDAQAKLIAQAAATGSDPVAVQAVAAFISAYGGRAGNLAMQVMATGGVYVAGGIAAKNVERMKQGDFLAAFLDKGQLFHDILIKVPVHVVMEQKTALLGAAHFAMIQA